MKSSTSIVYNGIENSHAPVKIDEEGIITCLIAFVRGDSGHTPFSGEGTSVEEVAVAVKTDFFDRESVGMICSDVNTPISACEKKKDKEMNNIKNIMRFMERF